MICRLQGTTERRDRNLTRPDNFFDPPTAVHKLKSWKSPSISVQSGLVMLNKLAPSEDEAFDFLLFCDALISQSFRVSWFKGIIDKEDLIQDLYIHFEKHNDLKPQPGLLLKVARGKLIDLWRRESRKKTLDDSNALTSRWRSLTSILNAREQFDCFAQTLSPKEIEIFSFLSHHHKYNRKADAYSPNQVATSWSGEEFYKMPERGVIKELAAFLGISENATSRRLGRIRSRYFLFCQEIHSEKGSVCPTYVERELPNLASRGLCDKGGWLTPEGAAILLDQSASEVIEECRLGKIDAARSRIGESSAVLWSIKPCEIQRRLWRSPRKAMSFETAMSKLAMPSRSYPLIRRVAWDSLRGLSGELLQEPASSFYTLGGIVADCLHETRDRSSPYTWVRYKPTLEDRNANDWVTYDRNSAYESTHRKLANRPDD